MHLKNIVTDSTNIDSLGARFRKKRFAFFRSRAASLRRPLRILDIGGLESYWVNNDFFSPEVCRVTLLNLQRETTQRENFESIVGDAADLRDFADNEFDITFSNSVIEHLKSPERQAAMASGVQRVGVYHFIQVPNRYFPIEPHYLLPFMQFFPASLKYALLTKTRISRGRKWAPQLARQYIDEIRLLSIGDMARLFPASHLYLEKVAGLVKSITAHNLPDL